MAAERTHVLLSKETLRAINAAAGPRSRSRFLDEAAREKLARMELEKALWATAGIAQGPAYRHWRDRRAAADWVRKTRRTEGPR